MSLVSSSSLTVDIPPEVWLPVLRPPDVVHDVEKGDVLAAAHPAHVEHVATAGAEP